MANMIQNSGVVRWLVHRKPDGSHAYTVWCGEDEAILQHGGDGSAFGATTKVLAAIAGYVKKLEAR